MKALFIGRFQPFHNGHLKLIKSLNKEFNEIIIGIGSSQYGHSIENPFTSEERKLMIRETLDEHNVDNYRIIEIPDIHNYPKWVYHILTIMSDFDVIITNNPLTKRLFLEKGYKVKNTPLFDRDKCSGDIIRKKIINDDDSWIDSIPSSVLKIIEKINGISRLKNLFNN